MKFSFIKNTDNQPDTALTMLVVAFLFVVVKVCLNGVVLTVAGNTVNCGVIDGGLIAALLTPLGGLYGWRRHTDISNNAVEAMPESRPEKQTVATQQPPANVAVQNVATEIRP